MPRQTCFSSPLPLTVKNDQRSSATSCACLRCYYQSLRVDGQCLPFYPSGLTVATSLACGCHPCALRSVPFATWVLPSVHEMMAASLLRCCIPLNACALARFIVSIAKVQKIIDAVKYKLLNKCKIYTFFSFPAFLYPRLVVRLRRTLNPP